MPFRYDIQLNGRTNVYEHKPLADSVDRMAMRATLFGLNFAGKFGKLPHNFAELVWEVLWMHCLELISVGFHSFFQVLLSFLLR